MEKAGPSPTALALWLALASLGGAASLPAAAATSTGVYSNFLNGHFAASQSDPDLAATEWLQALRLDPANTDLVQQTFIQALLAGRPEAANLAARLPTYAPAQIVLAIDAAQAGRWTEAEERFAAVSSNKATQLLRPVLIAWAQQGAGNTDQALATLEPYVKDQQLAGMYALHAALIADVAGRPEAAKPLYAAARAGAGVPPLRLAQLIGGFDARNHQEGEALAALDAVADGAPLLRLSLPGLAAHLQADSVHGALDGIAEACFDLGAVLHQEGDNRFAAIFLRLALTLRPDLSVARLLDADVMESRRDLPGAIQALSAVADTDPLAPSARVKQAELTARGGQPKKALEELTELANAFPDSPMLQSEIGNMLRATGDFAGAVTAYTRAITLVPRPGAADWPLFYERGVAHDQHGDWQAAEADLKRALQLQPDQPLVLNYLGYSWADKGEHLAQARDMLETAAQLRPDDGAVLDSLGWVIYRQGDAQEAIKMLERAVELDPADATINGHLGDAYWAIGRKIEATYQWRRALIFNPAPADAAKLEAKLHETTAQATTNATQATTNATQTP